MPAIRRSFAGIDGAVEGTGFLHRADARHVIIGILLFALTIPGIPGLRVLTTRKDPVTSPGMV